MGAVRILPRKTEAAGTEGGTDLLAGRDRDPERNPRHLVQTQLLKEALGVHDLGRNSWAVFVQGGRASEPRRLYVPGPTVVGHPMFHFALSAPE